VKEILNGVGADLCFPPYSTCSQLQRTEDAVAGPDEYEVAYDRRRMCKSTACFKVPQGRYRHRRLLSTRGVGSWSEKNNQEQPC
jgi:hypothetical protein